MNNAIEKVLKEFEKETMKIARLADEGKDKEYGIKLASLSNFVRTSLLQAEQRGMEEEAIHCLEHCKTAVQETRAEFISILPQYLYEYGIEDGSPKPLEELTAKEMFDLVASSAELIRKNNE